MKYNTIINTITISKYFIDKYIKEGQIVVDATVGNGKDTLLMAKRVGESGRVYGFDIQDIAINRTKELLNKNNIFDRVTLIKDSHEYIEKYIDCKIDFIVYNLGYLPSGDKNIITKTWSTILSVKSSLSLLNNNGLLLISSYIGHEGGLEENIAIDKLLKNLDQKKFNVLKYEFINQKNSPPLLYIIEKAFIK